MVIPWLRIGCRHLANLAPVVVVALLLVPSVGRSEKVLRRLPPVGPEPTSGVMLRLPYGLDSGPTHDWVPRRQDGNLDAENQPLPYPQDRPVLNPHLLHAPSAPTIPSDHADWTSTEVLEEVPAPYVLDPCDDQPFGVVGREQPRPTDILGDADFFPIDDRWRLGFPAWDRYVYSGLLRPYRQSVIKGDYPILGSEDTFFELTAVSDTLFQIRDLPASPGVGKVQQRLFQETVLVTTDFFQAENTFHPSEWFVSLTQAFRVVDNSAAGTIADYTLQEAFINLQLGIVSDYYDTTDLRLGRQGIASDFRGLVFLDTNDAVRLFGTLDALRTAWNVFAVFPVMKEAANGLGAFNTFDSREQIIVIANITRQDFVLTGFNAELAAHYNNDARLNHVEAVWLEVAVDGHLGGFDVNSAFVQVLGNDAANPIAGRPIDINAQLVALEVARPINWFIPKVSAIFASGDKNPTDGNGRGFDAISDNPFFAGGGFSYLGRQVISPGGVRLSNTFSFLPNLRTKTSTPANFVNPGLFLFNAGFDAVLTTRLVARTNVNFYQFVHSEPVELLAGKTVGKKIGVEVNAALIYKPLIVDNLVFTVNAAVLDPGEAISDLSGSSSALFQVLTTLTVVY